jgi:CubicO group peptidase (beta-lactamase class C family)
MAQMAEIVSKVSGIPYEDYVTRSILKPLALDHTSANIPADREPRAATGYGAPDKAGQRPSMPIIRSAGGYHGAVGIQTTAEDLGRFASWLMGAGEHDPVLKRSTLDAFQKLQAITKSDLGEGHGVVYMMRKRNDGVTVGHTGTLIGHRSALIMDPKHKTAFVVLTNAVDTNREAITDEAQRQVFPAIVKATPPAEKPAPGKLRHPAFARHLGTYQKVGGNEQKVVAVDAQGNLTIDGARLVKTPGKRRTFDQPGQSYTDRKGETVTFAPGATHSSLSPTFEFESGGVVWKRVP